MTTPTSKTQCFACQEETRTFICEGCSQSFCRLDLTKHIQILNEELDQIEYQHDQCRETLLHQKEDPNKYSLIQEINQWKEESIRKIEQTANECRERLINYKNDYIIDLENQLKNLAEEIKRIRGENEFNEIDLNQLKEKLIKLEENLHQPPNLSIQQQLTSFINNISVITPPGKDLYFNSIKSKTMPPSASGTSKEASKSHNAPRRPSSAFFLFLQDERPDIIKKNPSLSAGDIAQEIGARWSKASDDVRKRYEQKAGVEKQKYEQHLSEYKKSGGGGSPSAKSNSSEEDED